MRDFRDAKLMARTLKAELAKANLEITHSRALELVARQMGFEHWNILAARIAANERPQADIAIEAPIPIFRIFDVEKAMEFYRDFLGFSVDFEHRFGENFPLYCQVSRGTCVLHLSEHAGDASPGLEDVDHHQTDDHRNAGHHNRQKQRLDARSSQRAVSWRRYSASS